MKLKSVTVDKLNTLLDIEFEQWPKHGVKLRAVSANANGRVNSGITSDNTYFYRQWGKGFASSSFVIG